MEKLTKQKTKLRFLEKFSLKQYIEKIEFKDCINKMKLRLNMIETKCNFKGKYLKNQTCEICNENLDTTEHLFECKKMDKLNWQDKCTK